MNRQDFQAAVAALPFGKVLPGARYLYLPPESTLDSPIAPLIARLRDRLGLVSSHHIIKLAHADFAISFLDYPDFLTHPHPDLHEAIRIQLATGSIKRINFSSHANPPILHRKESFLPPDHPLFPIFASLTKAEEAAGLYKDTSRIGFRDNWEEILRSRQLTIIGHSLHTTNTTGEERSGDIPVPDLHTRRRGLENPRSFPGIPDPASPAPPVILRHRTALARSELSKPIRTALASHLLRSSDSVFDFGCGHGTDVAALNAYGIPAAGWDPAFFPHNPITPASFVNLGFVLNVIESPAERVDVLQHAWKLTSRVLLVSTMIRGQEDYSVSRPHADGYITSRSTFQKYFDPSELQGLIEHALDADAHPAGLGIYAVFRNPQDAQDWLAEKIRRPVDWDTLSRKLGFLRPSIERRAVDAYEANRELLDACWLRMLDLGRFPTPDEFDRMADEEGTSDFYGRDVAPANHLGLS